ncbi:MAG: hypothetical protein H7222_04240 [Methylotenera sp.]|nr:hypothetical protein [Oligoflexia bacterium]
MTSIQETRSGEDWSEDEISASVVAYFSLMQMIISDQPAKKAQIYRQLSQQYPARTPKAFEAKFQNISAVLFEMGRAFIPGLKPRKNYQNCLFKAVTEYLGKSALQVCEPIPRDRLFDELRRLTKQGFIPVKGKGTGRFGLTLEHYLNIPQNCSKNPDYFGIELKTKRKGKLQTLFSRKPTRYHACVDRSGLLFNFGYPHKKRKNDFALRTSFNVLPNTLGFNLNVRNKLFEVIKNNSAILDFSHASIEQTLLAKHFETVYIKVLARKTQRRQEECRFDGAVYYSTPSLDRFIKLAREGSVYLDFTLSSNEGTVKDHGFLWRILNDKLISLYESSIVI